MKESSKISPKDPKALRGEILSILQKRIMVIDGAMGTMIQNHFLSEKDFREGAPFADSPKELKGNNDCLNITHPEIISSIHREYIEAGADIIETNTFSSNRISQSEYGLGDYASLMALEGAKVARDIADKANTYYKGKGIDRKIFVAGSMGPTSKSLTLASDITDPSYRQYSFGDMVNVFKEQAEALIKGGVDMILLETCFDALNTKAALYAINTIVEGFPVMVSASANDLSGRTLTGQTLEAFYDSVSHYPLISFGINCSLGAKEMIPLVEEISSFCPIPVSCYPNAGLPNEMGAYDDKPSHMASCILKMAEKGTMNIVGGCCGTTPDHICAEATAVSDVPPRSIPSQEGDKPLRVSGLESVKVDLKEGNFCNIGERTNVAGSRKFARLIASGEYDQALQVAADQIENGASIIDINMDDALLDSNVEMEKFVRHIQNDPSVAKAALMIDSSDWETILSGLKSAQGKCIVNSISLKEGEEVFLSHAKEIHSLGAAMVVMAFDEEGQATTYERKISICKRAYDLLTGTGIPPEDIIFDVNVLAVGTGIAEHSRYGIDFIEAVRWIKENLPGCRTSGGISNLSFSFRGNNPVREAMHSVFLYHAIKAGLDMGIVNPGMLQVYDEIDPDLRQKAEDVILDSDPEATERLIAKAGEILARKDSPQDPSSSAQENPDEDKTPEERLSDALVKGSSKTLEADVLECLGKYGKAVQVIEGPLMAGMEKVGQLFGDGKMFLPQVVKSAKIMRDAVAILEPYMKEEESSSEGEVSHKPLIINATVKGDVHDIGKNITGIVLSCNGFEVVDLGVMVEKERILDEATRRNAAIIGVSGLITPSLHQMEEICREMTSRGMSIPLFIGGATTSALHTAVKLAPLYDHVFYCHDASEAAVKAKKCLMDREAFEKAEHEEQSKLRGLYEMKKKGITLPSVNTIIGYRPESYLRMDDFPRESMEALRIPVGELMGCFDWPLFFAVWGVKSDAGMVGMKKDPERKKLFDEALAILKRFKKKDEVAVRVSMKIVGAHREGNDIVLEDGTRLPMLRQERIQKGLERKERLESLSDFVPDKEDGFEGPIGLFAISVNYTEAHRSLHPEGCNCEACATQYGSMMERSVRVTLAETASKWLDLRLKKLLKGHYSSPIRKPAAGYYSCPDHSIKRDILSLLPGAEELGITLTESCAMIPDASVSGFILFHSRAGYPEIMRISRTQYDDYCKRRGFTPDEGQIFLGHLL